LPQAAHQPNLSQRFAMLTGCGFAVDELVRNMRSLVKATSSPSVFVPRRRNPAETLI